MLLQVFPLKTMPHKFLHLAFTPAVLAVSPDYDGRSQVLPPTPDDDPLGSGEAVSFGARNNFYMSSVNELGWPYPQQRSGTVGFGTVTGPNEILFPDCNGNRQMLTTRNVSKYDRVCLFMMSYSRRERLKLLGDVEVLNARDLPQRIQQATRRQLVKTTERFSPFAPSLMTGTVPNISLLALQRLK